MTDIVWIETMIDDTTSLGFFCYCPECNEQLEFYEVGLKINCPKCGCLLKITRSPDGLP